MQIILKIHRNGGYIILDIQLQGNFGTKWKNQNKCGSSQSKRLDLLKLLNRGLKKVKNLTEFLEF